MEIVKLIGRADIASVKQISETVYDDVLNTFILEAQIQDLAPLLGEYLYNDVVENLVSNEDLLNGGTYIYNDVSYINYGIKKVLSYYAYARYQMHGSIIDTPFSTIEKLEGAESRPTGSKTRLERYQIERDMAFTLWRSVENFLIRTENELYLKSLLLVKQKPVSYTLNKIE